MTITPTKIAAAAKYLKNADIAARAAESTGLPYAVACALLEKESGGRNVYGRDSGGALSGFPGEVNRANYEVFRWLIFDKGQPSNGCGPCQITFRGFFPDMEDQGLKPWRPYDNMRFGFRLLRNHRGLDGTWAEAGERYNGTAAYGADLARRIDVWRKRLR